MEEQRRGERHRFHVVEDSAWPSIILHQSLTQRSRLTADRTKPPKNPPMTMTALIAAACNGENGVMPEKCGADQDRGQSAAEEVFDGPGRADRRRHLGTPEEFAENISEDIADLHDDHQVEQQ